MRFSARIAAVGALVALAAASGSRAQSQLWSRAYNGPGGAAAAVGDGFDITRSLAADGAGNLYATGTATGSIPQFLTTRINGATGAIAWQKTFQGTSGKGDAAIAVTADPAGNAIVAGWSYDASGNTAITVIKYAAADGAVAWQKSLAGGTYNVPLVVAADAAGNAIVGGETNAAGTSDLRIVKLAASSGAVLWDKTFDGGRDDFMADIAVDGSGNVAVLGTSVNAAGNLDFTIAKYDGASGAILWKRTWDGAGDDRAYRLALDAGGNVLATGSTRGATDDLVVLKLAAADGALAWKRTWDGGSADSGQALAIDASGNAIVAGQSRNAAGNADFVTLKLAAADGTVLWQKTFDGGRDDYAYDVVLDGAGNAVVAGSTTGTGATDWKVVAYAPADGAIVYQAGYAGSAGQADEAYAAVATRDGVVVAGTVNETGSATQVRLAKLANGVAPAPAASAASSITSPAPGAALGSTSVTFTWDAGSGVTNRFLAVGTHAGGNEIYGGYVFPATSQTVSGMPSNGSTVYVTLMSMVNGAWQTKGYTYTAMSGGKSAIVYPVPGSVLPSAAVVFSWTAGAGVTARFLAVGTTPGGNDIFGGYVTDQDSQTVTRLPLDGATVYVRLMSQINGAWTFFDYTYTGMTPGQASLSNILSPVPGSVLAPSTVFNWTAGNGVANRFLTVGTILGGSDIYGSYKYGELSQPVSGIPRNGAPLYVTLMSLVNGAWQTNSYIYSAAAPDASVITGPVPGSTLSGPTATFTWDAGTGVTNRFLAVGTYLGGNDIYGSYAYPALSQQVSGLPMGGRTVYVRLMSRVNGAWKVYDFTYTSQ